MRDFRIPDDAPVGSYHDLNTIRTSLNAIPQAISSHDSVLGMEMELGHVVERLFNDYDQASDSVNALDFASMPIQIVLADFRRGLATFIGGGSGSSAARRTPTVILLMRNTFAATS